MVARTPMNQNWTPRASMAPVMWTGTVRASREPIVRAKMNSFQVKAKRIRPVAAIEGGGERQGDAPEGGPVAGSVDQGGFLELDGEVEEGLADDDDDEGEDE